MKSKRTIEFEVSDNINFSYREHIKQTLLLLGVEHIAVSVVMPNKLPYYLEVNDLRERLKSTSREKTIQILESYSAEVGEPRSQKVACIVNKEMWVSYFCSDELVIKYTNPYLYIEKMRLDCGSQVVLYIQSLEALDEESLFSLRRFSYIVEKWVISWLAHQRLLFSLANFQNFNQEAYEFKLTKAEQDVLNLMLKGYTSNEIAVYRQVSKETVRCQIKSLLYKTGCHSQNELIASHSHFNHLCYSLFD
ncbi:helix-turn-helix transcriptional regulator [Vibrio sp. SCSIO 43140]|uniref:helix-turn-helix transcriptional regulator n=1 Tax=Vibrio sp. SCSIO 43140 TaxID=2819100 RepID=UPI0020761D7F|nr:helix-turn-helix transcriptional regulator [Vibrio sp. SCSIO 43140]USD63665.1 helix-turn-helix transcriptional regulator [Vibrio sp. SCSIO 43140]